jgi:putative transposase
LQPFWKDIEEKDMSYRQICYQIAFSTGHRTPSIAEPYCAELYSYIWGIIQKRKCKLLRVNGTEDHIHIFCDLHPSVSLADLVRDIKVGSSMWMKESKKFPGFSGWQDGYGAFTYNFRERDMIINYVKNQKEHHKSESSLDEFRRLLLENGIAFDEKYLL